VGITVHEATITLRIVAMADSIAECDQKIAETRSIIYDRLGPYIFGEEDDELQQAIVRLLNGRGETLSTAETATGGLVAHRITEVVGHEACFLGGVVLSGSTLNNSLLALDTAVLSTSGPVSEAVAGQMAEACRRQFNSDYALSVTACGPLAVAAGSASGPVAFIALSNSRRRDGP